MFKAIYVNLDTNDRCKKILGVRNIPNRCHEEVHFVIWGTNGDPYLGLLPYAVFRDTFVVIAHTDTEMLCERL